MEPLVPGWSLARSFFVWCHCAALDGRPIHQISALLRAANHVPSIPFSIVIRLLLPMFC